MPLLFVRFVKIYSYFPQKAGLFIEITENIWYHIRIPQFERNCDPYGQSARKTL